VLAAAFADNVDITPGQHPENQLKKGMASDFMLRLWGAAADNTKTCDFKIYLFPRPGARRSPSDPLNMTCNIGTGILIADLTVNLAGFAVVNKHPITGVAVDGTTFYEMSAVSATTYSIGANIVQVLTGGSGKSMPVIFNTLGMHSIFVQVNAAADVTRVIGEITRLC